MTLSISRASPILPLARPQSALSAETFKPDDADPKALTQADPKTAQAAPVRGGGDTKPESDKAKAVAGPTRQEVDRRVSDSVDVKVTVIAYSDGSSETLTEMKSAGKIADASDLFAAQGRIDEPVAGPITKGALIDRVG